MTAAIVVGVVFGALAGYFFALWRREYRHCEQWCGEATRIFGRAGEEVMGILTVMRSDPRD